MNDRPKIALTALTREQILSGSVKDAALRIAAIAAAGNGHVLISEHMGGKSCSVGDLDFGFDYETPRLTAKLDDAIEYLQKQGYLRARGNGAYQLTTLGFDKANPESIGFPTTPLADDKTARIGIVPASQETSGAIVPAPGMRIGRYELDRELGAGGMGTVYRARDTILDRFVAIKFLSYELRSNLTAQLRFKREATLAAKIQHPNACTVYDIGDDRGLTFIVMQYLDGITLGEILARGRISTERAINFAIQIAAALVAAHAEAIVHRDLKPRNVMVTRDGSSISVLDFGLAKDFTPTTANDSTPQLVTHVGDLVGTPAYMSPEQLRAENLDGRSDIFTFGILLYEMLTGTNPFQRQTQPETIAAILRESPRSPLDMDPQLTEPIAIITLRCLEKDRSARYQTMSEVAAELSEVRSSGETTSSRAAPMIATTDTAIDRARQAMRITRDRRQREERLRLEGAEAASAEVLVVFEEINRLATEIAAEMPELNLTAGWQRGHCVVRVGRIALTIDSYFKSPANESRLVFSRWFGGIVLPQDEGKKGYREKPQKHDEASYFFDLSLDGDWCWRSGTAVLSSIEVANKALEIILDLHEKIVTEQIDFPELELA